MPSDNPFLDYLEDRPEAGYFSNQNQWRTPNQRDYFRSQFSNIQNQYLGQLGQWVKGGSQGQPQKFLDFLGQYPWQQKFQELTPSQQGQDASRFNPFVRWLT